MGIEKLVKKLCVQDAVYWGIPKEEPKTDGFGNPIFDSPIAIKCRWDGTSEIMRDSNGVEKISKGKVMVTFDVQEQGYLFLGTLSDIDRDESPKNIPGAYQIGRFDKIPMVKSKTEFIRTAYLGWQTMGK